MSAIGWTTDRLDRHSIVIIVIDAVIELTEYQIKRVYTSFLYTDRTLFYRFQLSLRAYHIDDELWSEHNNRRYSKQLKGTIKISAQPLLSNRKRRANCNDKSRIGFNLMMTSKHLYSYAQYTHRHTHIRHETICFPLFVHRFQSMIWESYLISVPFAIQWRWFSLDLMATNWIVFFCFWFLKSLTITIVHTIFFCFPEKFPIFFRCVPIVFDSKGFLVWNRFFFHRVHYFIRVCMCVCVCMAW